jgi:adenine-specific DNA methylase
LVPLTQQVESLTPLKPSKSTRRLIEEWLPIAALSEESIRERRSMTALPPTYYLHVWWARRPLVASRAAVLSSLLPANADHLKFLHALGIHGDPVAAKLRIAAAARNVNASTGKRENLGANPYGYTRAFSYCPTDEDRSYLRTLTPGGHAPRVLDSTAGGGSIPFESLRLGCDTIGNDLNPVAWLILKATVEFPAKFGTALLKRYQQLTKKFIESASSRFVDIFPTEPDNVTVDAYLWARTVRCPYCNGLVPLAPNWKLNNKGVAVRVIPHVQAGRDRVCTFEIVNDASEESTATVKGGDGLCPFPDCGRVFSGSEIQTQAKAGNLKEQLYAIVYSETQVVGHNKNGKPKLKKIRRFRIPTEKDDVGSLIQTKLDEKTPEWEAKGILPDEDIPDGHKTGDASGAGTDKPKKIGVTKWRDMFAPRQLFGHCTSVEVFRELFEECGGPNGISEIDCAALSYIAISIDKLVHYNARSSRWHARREVIAGVFERHDFSFKWSFCEIAPAVTGLGFEWASKQIGKSLKELIHLSARETGRNEDQLTFSSPAKSPVTAPNITLSCGSGDALAGIAEKSVDAVVLDPPYYDNVMYAELSDFFYVWLKRTAGLLFPSQFADQLTDKDREAVANPSKFKDFSKVRGSGGANKRASRDYQERMQAIFAEARRVLKAEGIMTLMFTHKATGAWDALAKGLVDAGFVITASWPIQTEAEGSLHIKDKNAAKSTIFLVCRPRETAAADAEATYWEEVEPKVTAVVKEKVAKFQEAGIRGVDLYLACFGPALQVFSEFWPIKRGRANQRPLPAKGAQLKLLEDEEWDPYAVRPEDALMAARGAVKQWRLQQLTTVRRQAHLDPVTEWFVLAWDAFQSPQFPADEALKLARVVGVNFDDQLRNKVLEVKGGDVVVWDSGQRAKKSAIGSMTGTCRLDALHHAAQAVRERNVGVAKELVERAELHKDGAFLLSLEAALQVLPTPRMVSGKGVLAGAAADAEALEKLRKLMFAGEVPQSKEWMLFDQPVAGQ